MYKFHRFSTGQSIPVCRQPPSSVKESGMLRISVYTLYLSFSTILRDVWRLFLMSQIKNKVAFREKSTILKVFFFTKVLRPVRKISTAETE